MAYEPRVSGHTNVTPNGIIRLYSDVPFDSEYTHTLNRNANNNADLLDVIGRSVGQGYCQYVLTKQSYSRLTESSVRISVGKDSLIHCNYMAISNGSGFPAMNDVNGSGSATQIENKTFYCFVTDVEYVNNTTSDVYFQVDYLQTYWFNFTVPANFIEREHCAVSEDTINNNLINEQLDTGELVCWDLEIYRQTPRDLVVCYSPNYSDGSSLPNFVAWNSSNQKFEVVHTLTQQQINDQFAPQIQTGIIGAQAYLRIGGTTPQTTASIYAQISHLLSATIAIAQGGCKTISVQYISGEIADSMWGFGVSSTFNKWITLQTNFKSIDGSETYVPKNKKLLQYPYCQLLVTNNNGSTETYHPEFFRNTNNQVNFSGKMYLNPNAYIYVYPQNYRGLGEDVENGVALDYFPQIPFSEDSYAQWWAKSKDSFQLGIASQVASTAIMCMGAGGMVKTASEISSVTSNIDNVGTKGFSSEIGVSSASLSQHRDISMNKSVQSETKGGSRRGVSLGYGVLGVARSLGTLAEAKNAPDSLTMSNGNGNLQVIQGRCGFNFYKMGITIDRAKILDKYFDMYGYKCHRVKVPSYISDPRSVWNYTKTQNCMIKGATGYNGLPETAQSAIQAIFNNGITMWRSIAQIGDYNLDNHSNAT